MAGIKDVAYLAGVSISTVSNVLNNAKYVSDELKIKVNKAVTELGYEVDPVARSLRCKKTMKIGVVITNINRVFFTQVLKGIQDTASKEGFNITFCNTNDDFKTEKDFVQMLESSWVDGIILDSVADTADDSYFKYLAGLGNQRKFIPVVSLERKLDNYGISSVGIDNYKAAEIATRHLIECGCRKLLHISGPAASYLAQERLRGFRAEITESQLEYNTGQVLTGDFSPLSGYQAVKKAITSGMEYDGIYAANDQMAIGAIKAAREHGLRIPEDIKIVGFDNTFVASVIEPSLTTIDVPKYKLGVCAAEELIKKIQNGVQTAGYEELPVNLIIRQSTDLHGDKNWDLYGW